MRATPMACAAAVSFVLIAPARGQAPEDAAPPFDPAVTAPPADDGEAHEPAVPEAPAPAAPAAAPAAAPTVAAAPAPAEIEPAEADAPAGVRREIEGPPPPDAERLLHGFRLGYMFVNDYDRPIDKDDPGSSLKEQLDMKSPHLFVIGYEVMRRMVGHSWLNVILVGNAMVAGLEQSKFYPSANFLIGFEIDRSFQIGVGPNLTPTRDKAAHVIFAAGWTPLVGRIYLPVHAFYVPDVDGNFRTGMTVGVNW